MGLVYGVGIYERGEKYVCSVKKIITREYDTWQAILQRCYGKGKFERRKTYQDCEVDSRFHRFQDFCSWAENQVGFCRDGWQLDKDLLIKRNRIYSPETCLFLPHEINSVLLKTDAKRGNWPIGVTYRKGIKRYVAQISLGDLGKKHIGCYTSPEEAFEAYKSFKEGHLKIVANKYKDEIDSRAYYTLLNYEVEIDD